MGVLERWLTELGVAWVLHLGSDASAWDELADEHTCHAARSWIRALCKITETIRSMAATLFADRGSMSLLPSSIYEEEEGDSEAGGSVLELLLFARFIQETMLKMVAFVDFIVSLLDPHGVPVQALHQKIHILLRVHGALSDALTEIKMLFLSMLPSAEVERIRGGLVNLLYAKNAKVRESIRSRLENIRISCIMEPLVDDDSTGAQTPQVSSDIDKVTLSVMAHITFLLENYSPVDPIVSEAAILGNMIIEMVCCLQERIVLMSKTFQDQSLRFLFLLNNFNFICHSLHNNTTGFCFLQVHVTSLLEKVEHYLESYLQVSWGPVLSCLFNTTPVCFGKNYSLLPKFESEFQKMYTTQMLWKVPDPEMRKRLRKAITEKIILGYAKYIEDNNVTTPRSTTHNLEEMLQELFEG
ncbi:hypothetical protein SORBI_3010G272200 [Sorghum bicolor]|uniref:Exocyst subunit Exo70 family protein n=1 Tax=Sorghum bicolor TaxID=4558 RepID=A0A194YLW7_SORBI|nr:hypothetical protein SORBI_3010G272200 [Sorghum bicolor]